ncbi:hypothetical protein DL89DRAFT_311342 [Linderina pennispora]|uniref:Uncharacterized protein n=1 Tax=Linderina pennispora TaxID=61395 RepID=A0A1Y1WF26_9FUNG|nr:uncharacterized protein DL89DRAFT_311342 [Linderina pennispora]ORX71928.1 hypothetical protein DL89DRAFT_311342 [Linderina pennispora]
MTEGKAGGPASNLRQEQLHELTIKLTKHIVMLEDRKTDIMIRLMDLTLDEAKDSKLQQAEQGLAEVEKQLGNTRTQLDRVKFCEQTANTALPAHTPLIEAITPTEASGLMTDGNGIKEWHPYIHHYNEQNKDQLTALHHLPRYTNDDEEGDDIETFLDKFQHELSTYGLPLDNYWTHLLPVCFVIEDDKWLRSHVSPSLGWRQAHTSIVHHFAGEKIHYQFTMELFQYKTHPNESPSAFVSQYWQHCSQSQCKGQ